MPLHTVRVTVRAGLVVAALCTVGAGPALAGDGTHLASSPHYELVNPATSHAPASYAYYPHGDNPRFGSGSTASTGGARTTRRGHVLTRPIHTGRCAAQRCDRETFGEAVAVGAGRTVGWALARGLLSLF